jgi:hypothetical protein
LLPAETVAAGVPPAAIPLDLQPPPVPGAPPLQGVSVQRAPLPEAGLTPGPSPIAHATPGRGETRKPLSAASYLKISATSRSYLLLNLCAPGRATTRTLGRLLSCGQEVSSLSLLP